MNWRPPERQLTEAGLWERRPGYGFQIKRWSPPQQEGNTMPENLYDRVVAEDSQMRAAQALDVIADIAARWGENAEEALPRRVQAHDSDEDCARIAAEDGEFETEEVVLIRDLWRALEVLRMITEQRGCEHFDPAVEHGKLTSLIDVIVFG